MPNLFGPGTVIIPPDKETSIFPYVPGVIMNAATGAVTGAVPNSVVATSDGAVLGDGTMGFNDHLTPFNFRIYDVNFNQLSANVVFAPDGCATSPPPPCSDFVNWFYVCSRDNIKNIKRISKAGVVDAPTWNLAAFPSAFAVSSDNSIFYYFDGLGNIQTWNLAGNVAGPTFFAAALLPPGIGTGTTLRVVPAAPDRLCALMNNINTGFVEMWQFATVTGGGFTAGQVITKTAVTGLAGNTDPTMELVIGAPTQQIVVRSFPGPGDRTNGCVFDFISLQTGAIVTHWAQTIAQADGGVPGGVLPATCPVVAWVGCLPPVSKRPGCQGFGGM